MDPDVWHNRAAWEAASQKYVREHQELLDIARAESCLTGDELVILSFALLARRPETHVRKAT